MKPRYIQFYSNGKFNLKHWFLLRLWLKVAVLERKLWEATRKADI